MGAHEATQILGWVLVAVTCVGLGIVLWDVAPRVLNASRISLLFIVAALALGAISVSETG